MDNAASVTVDTPAERFPLLRATGLCKRFGRIRAVDGVTLELDAGQTLCVVGPNGAGKTTLLMLLGGALLPSAGHISILGMDRWRDNFRIRQQSTFLTADPIFGASETPYEFLRFYAQIYGMPKEVFLERTQALAKRLEMVPHLRKPWDLLSTGMVKKAGLMAALLPDARLRILDEPFAGGIDPFAMEFLFQWFREATARGETIIFSTQVLEQAETIAGRILLLESGCVAAWGTPEELLALAGVATDAPRALYRAFMVLAGKHGS